MKIILLGVLAGCLFPLALPAATNTVPQTNSVAVTSSGTNNAVEAEFKALEEMDDAAATEVDKWIQENQAFAEKGGGVPDAQLNERIRARLAPVRKSYEDFIARYPEHARVRLAFGSFLESIDEDDKSVTHLEKALELDPKNPAVWNNLANHYGHTGAIKKAFEYYGKAMELNPAEPVYYHNLARIVGLFRPEAMEFYKITEQQVFAKALELYVKAFKLDPQNFNLATDLAQAYYGIRPTRTDDALKAWTNALALAHDDIEREGVQVHLARFKTMAGRTNEARAHLNMVTNEMYANLKRRIDQLIIAAGTNTTPTNPQPAKLP